MIEFVDSIVKAACIAVIVFVSAGCKTTSRGNLPGAHPAPIRMAACEGPAFSLPDSLARQLPPRTGRMRPDDQWADLAATVPGGFAGVVRDSTHALILLLTRPAEARAAEAALSGKIALAPNVVVREVRWDFAQLVDWFNYLLPRLGVPVTADKDEALNRIRFSVTSLTDRDLVVAALARLPLPCDLVVIDLSGLVTVRY